MLIENAARISDVLWKSWLIKVMAGAMMDEPNGERKVTPETRLRMYHFLDSAKFLFG